jgi:hypothetical protein
MLIRRQSIQRNNGNPGNSQLPGFIYTALKMPLGFKTRWQRCSFSQIRILIVSQIELKLPEIVVTISKLNNFSKGGKPLYDILIL